MRALRLTRCIAAAALPAARMMAAAAVTLLLWVTPAATQDFRSGRAAYDRDDYAEALTHWRPLAETGHADAQAALGYLYLKGLGVRQNDRIAAHWYLRAASREQIDALHILGGLYLAGHGVPKDPVRAFILCDRALSRGEAMSLRCRQDAELALSPEEMKLAQRRIATWRALAGRDVPTN